MSTPDLSCITDVNHQPFIFPLQNFVKVVTTYPFPFADFDSPTVEGRVFWASDIDLPLVGMETDACKFTSCPIVKGEKRSYDFTLPISRKFPSVRKHFNY